MRTSEDIINGLELAFKEKFFAILPYLLIAIFFLIVVPMIFRIMKRRDFFN